MITDLIIAIIPPALVGLVTENLGILVTITGAFAGAGIQVILTLEGRGGAERVFSCSIPRPTPVNGQILDKFFV